MTGQEIQLGGVAYLLPSISAAVARQHWDRIVAFQAGREADPLGLVSALVLACLRRNYPEIHEQVVLEAIDMDNVEEFAARVFGKGSFRRWCELQASQGNGEPQPATADGTGARSTPTSPAAPGTAPETSTS